ncbi:acylneuraminate cytidylyltransferase family protein [Macrococcoides goetzii]|nr:acylneuraminate cytidylyltransferase family protein [Macrococcus goetzii]TDM46079.1 acylneuraminate cytidylyltransferase family protein [Macrococcus goetzii]
MTNIAIIPARSGSKGLKNKNIKELNGIPLIAYTIIAAKNSGIFDEIIVSTDSLEYKKIAEKYGAKVPYLRDENLSLDHSNISDVILDILVNKNEVTSFMLLQPTSPLRNESNIKKAFKMFQANNYKPIISVKKCESKIELVNTLDSQLNMSNFIEVNLSSNRQLYKEWYELNGAIYISKSSDYLKNKTFYIDGSKAYIMDRISSIDIDNEFDFWLAEKITADFPKIKNIIL